jgi:large subunit ribosomal protein L2
MPLRKYKSVTPVRRYRQTADFTGLTKKPAEKALTESKDRTGGRNAKGRVTMRYRGGGETRRYRMIDFKRDKDGIPAKVIAIEYDPNRSARLALLVYKDGEKRYILAPLDLKIGDSVLSGPDAEARLGNCMPLENIPTGTQIHGVELQPGRGAQLVRSAGGVAQLVAKEGEYAQVRLPSGEVRKISIRCLATVGQVGNLDHANVSVGKAGRVRWKGFRPTVRGTVMNPVDHPMGGGEGKGKGNHPMTPWGKPTKGYKTRRGARPSDRYIVTRRTK